MEYKTLLVPVLGELGSTGVLGAACEVAKRHGSSIVGLYVIDFASFGGYGAAEVPPQIFELERERLLEVAAQRERVFKATCAEKGIDGEWRCVEGSTQVVVDLHARHCDLVCLESQRPDAGKGAGTVPGETFIFTTGRPVLVVPSDYAGAAIGDSVALAWNSSKESARAQGDALTVLKRAASVAVVSVADAVTSDRESNMIGIDIGRLLARHDVEFEVHTVHPGTTPVGEALHEWTRENRIDLVVMGAYGHSRLREMVLGGATRWMLGHATMPVLMSH